MIATTHSKEGNMKKTVNIAGAIAAEKSLAREHALELERSLDNLPDDSPLKEALIEEKGKLKGDLAGLPDSHPLLLEMEEARLRFEEEELYADEQAQYIKEQGELKEVRRAKRLEAKKVYTEQRRRDDDREELLREATKRINSSMSETMDSLKRLADNITASQEDFQTDQYSLMKLERLNRVLTATMRGIGQSKLNAGRAVINGR